VTAKQAFLVRKDSVRSSVRSKTGFLVRKEMVRKEVRSESKFLSAKNKSATMSALKWNPLPARI